MQWQGVRPQDMTQEQLDAAQEYTVDAIEKAAAQYSLLMIGFEELRAEYERREGLADKADQDPNRTLN